MTKDKVKSLLRDVRIQKSLARKGVEFVWAENVRYSDVTWIYRGRGAELDNAKVHRSYRYEVSGKASYHVKNILRAVGFRWDYKKKVWYKKELDDKLDLGGQMLRGLRTHPVINATA